MFESPSKDIQSIKFVNQDNLLLILDGVANSAIYFLTLSGKNLLSIDLIKSPLFIKNLYISGDSFLSAFIYNGDCLKIFNNRNLCELHQISFDYLLINAKDNIFYLEKHKSSSIEMGKKRRSIIEDIQFQTIIRKNKPDLGFISKLRFSPSNKFLAFSCSNFKKRLFIYDLDMEKLIFSLLFLKKIRKLDWIKNDELVILCNSHLIYFWNEQSFNIFEKFYTTEGRFDRILFNSNDKVLAFKDTEGEKICMFNYQTSKEL